MRLKKTSLFAALACLFFAQQGRAQFIGYTSPQTITQNLFNAVSTTGPSAVVRNLGQSVHYLTYFTGGTVNTLSIQLEGSQDGTNWVRISETSTDPSMGGCYANVYLPFVRANLTVLTGTSPTVTAYYSGTSVSAGPPAGVFSTTSLNTKVLASGASDGTTVTYSVTPPSGSTAGILYLTFTAANSGATVSVSGGPDSSHLATVLATTTLQNSTSTQTVSVAPFSANAISVTFTKAGSPGGGTYDLRYQFGVTQAVSQRARTASTGASGVNLASAGSYTVANVSGQGAGQISTLGCKTETVISGTATALLDVNIDNKGIISLPFISGASYDPTGLPISALSNPLGSLEFVSTPFVMPFANSFTVAVRVSSASAGGALTCSVLYGTYN